MLIKREWFNCYKALETELLQSKDEGKDVSAFVERVRQLDIELSITEEQYNAVNALLDEIEFISEPVKPEFNEPSELKKIKQLQTCKRTGERCDKSEMFDKIYGAWLGRVTGCLLGKPVENWTLENINKIAEADGNYPIKHYMSGNHHFPGDKFLIDELLEKRCFIENVQGVAPRDDDTDFTVLALCIIEKYGRDFDSMDIVEGWLANIPLLYVATAEQVAYQNWAAHIMPPRSAYVHNPYREWIGAQIRGDFFGYINPGDPLAAADMAFRDARTTHVKNGIYGEMFVAAMIAESAVSSDLYEIVNAGLECIPYTSRLYRDISKVLAWHKDNLSYECVIDNIHMQYPQSVRHNAVHTIPNAMIVVTALLYGSHDYGDTLCKAVMGAMDTDCNGATVGSIIGMITGGKSIPSQWIEPINDTLKTYIIDYPIVKISDMANRTMEFIR